MIRIPWQISPTEFNLFVALDPDNIARMQKYDPLQVTFNKLGKPWSELKARTLIIGVANAEEMKEAQRMIKAGEAMRALEYLSRGLEYRIELGNGNEPGTSNAPDTGTPKT